MRIYCVGSFDSFPFGLLNQLDAIASSGKDVELIVGIENDSVKNSYSMDQRAHLLRSLKCVSSVVTPSPSILNESFVKDMAIEAVYRFVPATDGHGDDSNVRFAVPIALGIFHNVQYDSGIKIPETPCWEKVWETKGRTNDPSNTRLLTGYDETDFEPELFAERWLKTIQWIQGETVLDVGCGAGFLGDYLPRDGYVGVEKSPSLAENFIQRSNRVVVVQDAIRLPFKDGAFDHVISHSMLEYMPGKPEAVQAIKEMQRVARKTVFLGDLRTIQHAARPGKYVLPGQFGHTLFQRNDFEDIQEIDGFAALDPWWGGETRFNAMLRKNDAKQAEIIPDCGSRQDRSFLSPTLVSS